MRIESLIASGKNRDAVEAAKQYLKHAPGPEAEALAVKAYTARIEALQASGMHREAQALGALVSERFPAHQTQVAVLMRQSEVSTGNFDALLAELKEDWARWDKAVDNGTEQERLKIRDHMVDVLNRRNYVRNLVREVENSI